MGVVGERDDPKGGRGEVVDTQTTIHDESQYG